MRIYHENGVIFDQSGPVNNFTMRDVHGELNFVVIGWDGWGLEGGEANWLCWTLM